MIASYGIITGVDNSVTTVIAWRHLLTVLDWLDRQREHVANAALGLNHARCTGIGLQLALQPQDLDIDAAIENIVVNPTGLQQMFSRERLARCFEKSKQ